MAATRTPAVTEIAPGERDLIIRQGPTRQVVPSMWGLIGASPDPSGSGVGKLVNARAESLTMTPAFHHLVSRRRCIVPASAFHEFMGRGRDRRVLSVHRSDGQPMALAGLWTSWRDPRTGEEILSHVMITTSPNALMAHCKHRVPAILINRAAIDCWLDPSVTEPSQVLPLLGPAPDDLLVATPLATAAGSGQRDDAQLSLPWEGG